MIGACLAVAATATLGAIFVVHAQNADVTANDNANVNLNVNVPPPGPPANTNDNNTDQAPPLENVPSNDNHDLLPPSNDNEPPHLPTTAAPPAPRTEPNNGASAGSGGKRVKISHPELIKFFQDIKQVGNSLFGVLKKDATAPGTTTNDEKPSTPSAANGSTSGGAGQSTDQHLEKILSPDMIKFFTSIKKMGTSLFGVRKQGAPKPHHIVTADESVCVIAAIKAKDQSVIDGKTAETTMFTAAVTARADCQTAALGSTNGQQAALELCNKNFATAAGQSRDAFAKAQKDAWTTYAGALKVCVPSSSTTGEDIMIEDGNNTP